MNPFEMVVAIVIIVTIGGLLRTKYLAKHGVVEDKKGDKSLLIRQDNGQQQQEIKELKERVKVLERIVTDNNNAMDLDREIDKLRNS